MERVSPPYSPEQIESINGFQKSGYWHPFTCANREHGGDDVLVATPDGMECPTCGYTQDWVHGFMADGSWKELQGRVEAMILDRTKVTGKPS